MILTTVVFASPLFEKDNCMDAGGRATHGAVAEGLGEIIQINPLIPPFTKGEVNSYMITWSHIEITEIAPSRHSSQSGDYSRSRHFTADRCRK